MPSARRKAFGLTALALALGAAPAALACELPDEGSAPYRRLVGRVKYLPDVEAWVQQKTRERATVQFVLHLDAPQRRDGRCHWVIEVRAADRPWKRFLVPADDGAPVERVGAAAATPPAATPSPPARTK